MLLQSATENMSTTPWQAAFKGSMNCMHLAKLYAVPFVFSNNKSIIMNKLLAINCLTVYCIVSNRYIHICTLKHVNTASKRAPVLCSVKMPFTGLCKWQASGAIFHVVAKVTVWIKEDHCCMCTVHHLSAWLSLNDYLGFSQWLKTSWKGMGYIICSNSRPIEQKGQ